MVGSFCGLQGACEIGLDSILVTMTASGFSYMTQRVVGLLLLATIFTTPVALGQEASGDADDTRWTSKLVGKLAGSQASFQNWAEGGVNTLALSSGLDGRWENTNGPWSRRYDLRLAYGLVKQDTSEFRKAEDVIRLTATFKHVGDGTLGSFSPTVALNVRSQFDSGYNFEKNQFAEARPLPQKVSDFLSPGVFTQAIGLTYQHSEYLSQRFGVGGKQTVVLIDRLRELYNLDLDQTVRVEIGLEAFTEFEKEIFTNVHMKSSLGLFAAFNKPESPDLLWENLVIMKVNSWLQFNVEWAVLQDDDVSKRFQFKEVFTVGVVYSFL